MLRRDRGHARHAAEGHYVFRSRLDRARRESLLASFFKRPEKQKERRFHVALFLNFRVSRGAYFFSEAFHFSMFAACALNRSSVGSSTSMVLIVSPFSILFTTS